MFRSIPRAARRGGLLAVLSTGALACSPGVSAAQTLPWTFAFWKPIGVIASVVRVQPSDGKVDPVVNAGFGVGFYPSDGWGPALGLGWFSTDVRTGGLTIGRLRARPVMGGVGYTWVRGSLAIKTSLTAGIMFNHASLDRGLLDQIEGPASIDVHNSFAARLSAGVEYSLVRKLAVRGTLNYLMTRPSIVVATTPGQKRGTWNASGASMQAGVVFYPLR